MNIDFQKLFNIEYLLEVRTSDFPMQNILYILGGIFIILGIMLFLFFRKTTLLKPKKDFLLGFSKLFIYFGVSIIIVCLLAVLRFWFFDTRIVIFIPLFVFILISLYKAVFWFTGLGKRVEEYNISKTRDKYIPRKKKRKS